MWNSLTFHKIYYASIFITLPFSLIFSLRGDIFFYFFSIGFHRPFPPIDNPVQFSDKNHNIFCFLLYHLAFLNDSLFKGEISFLFFHWISQTFPPIDHHDSVFMELSDIQRFNGVPRVRPGGWRGGGVGRGSQTPLLFRNASH